MSLLSAILHSPAPIGRASRGRIQGKPCGNGVVEMKLGRTIEAATAGRVYFGRCGV